MSRLLWFFLTVGIIMILIICFLIGISEIRGVTPEKAENTLQVALRLDNKHLRKELEECQRYNLFQQAVLEIGEREYNEEYDCYDHAVDLQKKLREVGIESSIFINSDRDHAWVGIWLEAVSGEFIEPGSDYYIIEVRDNNVYISE